jgi:REP element-mobilizing transposase RayT/CheY-like chemotaxis protein
MSKPVLIVTPQTSFGSMLHSSLEETGSYRVFVASDEPNALIQLKSEGCELAFLDVDLGVEAVAEIGGALRTIQPDVGLIIVSDEESPPALISLRPWRLLRKPFYLPELIEMLSVAPGEPPEPIIEIPPNFPAPETADLLWLQDVNKAAQRLTRLTLESSAQAALITRGKNLWAYAGGLSQETANELVRIVTRNWDEQKGGDLLRFARLETTRAEHMLYATTLGEGAILALVFDAETPFSTIRSQANSLARSLSVEKTGQTPFVAEPVPKVREPEPASSDDDDLDMPSISKIIFDIPTPIPSPVTAQPASLRVDAPIKPVPVVKKKRAEHSALETRPSLPLAEPHVISRESSPPVPLRDLMVSELEETVKHEVDELEVTAPSKVRRPATPVRAPQLGELDETRPHSITEVAGRVILEPASPGLYHLNYACLLVPRFSAHYLTGDLADRLGDWVPHICIAFGWRLEFMAVRPEYMQWVVSVPPNISPGYLMRIMRQQTSEKIFSDFQRLKRENPSGDFWAPGYLIMGGNQPHPQQLVKDYIQQTRQRQGASQSRK